MLLLFFLRQVLHTFLVTFNEQRRPIMPLLTAMRRSQKLTEEQQTLREAWDGLTAKVSDLIPISEGRNVCLKMMMYFQLQYILQNI